MGRAVWCGVRAGGEVGRGIQGDQLSKLWQLSRQELRVTWARVVAVKWREVNDFEKHLEMEPRNGLDV